MRKPPALRSKFSGCSRSPIGFFTGGGFARAVGIVLFSLGGLRAEQKETELWSLKDVSRPPVPAVADEADVRNPIDRFVLALLEERGLRPVGEADRRVLIRRLSFDLLGLPPAPERVRRFVGDPDPLAYEKLVDEFLDSPHFGERWATHWLDIAHYADTHGFERDKRRDHAWRYRDYVIRAFNEDKPYDRFLREQIAGDVIAPDNPDAVVATGFLAAGPWDFVGQVETKSPVLRRAVRADDLDDMVTQVMTATVGMTVNCARCHDHKLDPVSQRDYYNLWAVFAGAKRAERDISAAETKRFEARRAELDKRLDRTMAALAKLQGRGVDLADLVGGGNGFGTGAKGAGLDARSGKVQTRKFGRLGNVVSNRFVKVDLPFVDGVFIPDGGPGRDAKIPISSTGLSVTDVPDSSAAAWDMIRNGPVASQFSTESNGVDYTKSGHTLLGLHANAGITFDLAAIRQATERGEMRFQAIAGYGGKEASAHADFAVYIDGRLSARREKINRSTGGVPLDVSLPEDARFLTLISTDGGNGIGHDQIFFGDPKLVAAEGASLTDENRNEIARLRREKAEVAREIEMLGQPPKFYGVTAEKPPSIKVLFRGNPESETDQVCLPGALPCVAQLQADFGGDELPEGERRRALADWIADPANPLTRRVIVNRLWQHHFGRGLVDTPSDLGLGGSRPSHPGLLDWLADELSRQGWSLKAMHRLMATSAAYRRRSNAGTEHPAQRIDADNRLLWRMNPRSLDAESVHDATLAVSGALNSRMGGPGFEDFSYQDAYAPIYTYVTPDKPDLWRRSVYRYVVRTTPHQFMTALDCPNPANLTPKRSRTTTAIQSLTLLNNEFMLKQAERFAARLGDEAGDTPAKVRRAFQLAFGREPDAVEKQAAVGLVAKEGMFALCRMLFNANEFVHVD